VLAHPLDAGVPGVGQPAQAPHLAVEPLQRLELPEVGLGVVAPGQLGVELGAAGRKPRQQRLGDVDRELGIDERRQALVDRRRARAPRPSGARAGTASGALDAVGLVEDEQLARPKPPASLTWCRKPA
jgi:hypothetical protein